MFDLDRFRALNDIYGHQVGDSVLQHTTERIEAELRPPDTLARRGGEEFMILLPQSRVDDAAYVAERLRKAAFDKGDEALPAVSMSLAVTQYQPGELADMILRRIDDALYRAKAEGRNRVITV